MNKNIIGITMGCAGGIGPEIIVKAYISNKLNFKKTLILGDASIIEYYLKKSKSNIKLNILQNFTKETKLENNQINILDFNNCNIKKIKFGKVDKYSGKASIDYIVKGVDLCQQKILSAIVTCPINKDSVNKAGSMFPGHTELLGYLTETKNYGMLLIGKYLRVLLVTKHIGISNVSKTLNKKKVIDIIKLADISLKKDFNIKKPKIAVLSLNPHNGENGLFGNEEKNIIIPAINSVKKNINVEGPFSADTLFPKVKNNYDCVVCMYHDQGLIPLKLLSFGKGVNITLGLPIVRTSVDHGTAFDIVNKNLANEGSLIEAIKQAKNIIKNRMKYEQQFLSL